MTDTYIRARKFFFKSLKDFFLVSLFSVDDVQLLKFINDLTSNKEIKTVEEKGPFISSSIISQLIKAETLCNIGISETLSPTYFNEGIQAYSKIINSLAQNNEMFQAKIFKRIAAVGHHLFWCWSNPLCGLSVRGSLEPKSICTI